MEWQRAVNNPLAHNNAIRWWMGETNVFRGAIFLFVLYDNPPISEKYTTNKMKLTKKEALVEAPDFFFPLVPAQPLMIEVEMKDEKGFFISYFHLSDKRGKRGKITTHLKSIPPSYYKDGRFSRISSRKQTHTHTRTTTQDPFYLSTALANWTTSERVRSSIGSVASSYLVKRKSRSTLRKWQKEKKDFCFGEKWWNVFPAKMLCVSDPFWGRDQKVLVSYVSTGFYISFSVGFNSFLLLVARSGFRQRQPSVDVLELVLSLFPSAATVTCQLASSTDTNCFRRSKYWLYNSTSLWPAPFFVCKETTDN